jgi:hypothetical protein
MKTHKPWLTLAAIAVIGGTSYTALRADADKDTEKPTSLDAIPAAAKAALVKEANGHSIRTVVEGTHDGATYYEATIEIRVDAKGNPAPSEEDEAGEKK